MFEICEPNQQQAAVLEINPMERNFRGADFEQLFHDSEARLLRLTRLRGVSLDDAHDILQETFIEAWRHIEQLHSPEHLGAWLDGICRNVCRRHQQRRGIAQIQEIPLVNPGDDDALGETLPYELPDLAASEPFAALERRDMAVLIDRALGYLPASTRDAVELCYLAEVPQLEAAVRLGVTISALEGRLHRARKQLRHILSGTLRAESETFGLPLGPASLAQWRESRAWCLICGKSRLWGIFEPLPAGGVNFRMRCPTCTIGEVFSSGGLVDFKSAHSFRPAMKRLATSFGAFFGNALQRNDSIYCWRCQQPVQPEVTQRVLPDVPKYTTWIAWQCRCGQAYSAGVVACFANPTILAFLLSSSRCVIEPDSVVTFQDILAVRFCLHDITNGRRMYIFAHHQSLAVLATVIE